MVIKTEYDNHIKSSAKNYVIKCLEQETQMDFDLFAQGLLILNDLIVINDIDKVVQEVQDEPE